MEANRNGWREQDFIPASLADGGMEANRNV